MILNLYNQGYSYSAIADIMKKSRFTIRSVIRRFSNLETVIGAPRGGRLKKLSVRERREIIVKKIHNSTSLEIAAIINNNFNKCVHPIIIRRVLRMSGTDRELRCGNQKLAKLIG